MSVLLIVPRHEAIHPRLGGFDRLERLLRIADARLHRAEERFDVRVVVAHSGAAVGRENAEALERGFQRCALIAGPLSE